MFTDQIQLSATEQNLQKSSTSFDIFLSKYQANRILDLVKAGILFPTHVVNLALSATGDLG